MTLKRLDAKNLQKNTENVTGLHPEIVGDFKYIKGKISKIRGNINIHKRKGDV